MFLFNKFFSLNKRILYNINILYFIYNKVNFFITKLNKTYFFYYY